MLDWTAIISGVVSGGMTASLAGFAFWMTWGRLMDRLESMKERDEHHDLCIRELYEKTGDIATTVARMEGKYNGKH